jgi:hypothetical protein
LQLRYAISRCPVFAPCLLRGRFAANRLGDALALNDRAFKQRLETDVIGHVLEVNQTEPPIPLLISRGFYNAVDGRFVIATRQVFRCVAAVYDLWR